MPPFKIILVFSVFVLLSATQGFTQQPARPAAGSPSMAAGAASAQGRQFEPGRIIELMRRVADFGLANKLKNRMDMNKDADWSTSTFRAGVMALYRVTKDDKYLKNTVAWGEANQWKLRGNGGGDDSCAGQTYCEMYLLDPRPENAIRYKHTQECFDKMLFDKNFNGFRAWSWQDSLFMGTPVVSMLGKITGKPEYYDRLVTGLNDAAEHLYNREYHLWYFRDTPALKTTRKGHPQFWGPGNAWVLGALTRRLDVYAAGLPASRRIDDLLQGPLRRPCLEAAARRLLADEPLRADRIPRPRVLLHGLLYLRHGERRSGRLAGPGDVPARRPQRVGSLGHHGRRQRQGRSRSALEQPTGPRERHVQHP